MSTQNLALPRAVFSQEEPFCFGDALKTLRQIEPDADDGDIEWKLDVYLDNLERHGLIRRGLPSGLRGGSYYMWIRCYKKK